MPQGHTSGVTFEAATINLRYANEEDPYPWNERKVWLTHFISERRPDFLATQEGFRPQLHELYALLKNDYFLADTHRPYKIQRMYPGLFVRRDWETIASYDRWLSPEPTVAGSIGFGSRWPKLGVAASVKRADHPKPLTIASFHFDNESAKARPEQARVLLEEIEKLFGLDPTFLMGDANDLPDSKTLHVLQKAGFVDPWKGISSLKTYHGFGQWDQSARIDYVLHRSSRHRVQELFIDDRKDHFYSDHYFVGARYETI